MTIILPNYKVLRKLIRLQILFPTCGRNYHDMLHLIYPQLRYILQIMHVCKCIIQI